MARRRRPRAEAPSRPIRVRFSPSEMERANAAANANGETLSAFIRSAVAIAADDILEPPLDLSVLRSRIPTAS